MVLLIDTFFVDCDCDCLSLAIRKIAQPRSSKNVLFGNKNSDDMPGWTANWIKWHLYQEFILSFNLKPLQWKKL